MIEKCKKNNMIIFSTYERICIDECLEIFSYFVLTGELTNNIWVFSILENSWTSQHVKCIEYRWYYYFRGYYEKFLSTNLIQLNRILLEDMLMSDDHAFDLVVLSFMSVIQSIVNGILLKNISFRWKHHSIVYHRWQWWMNFS